MRTKRGPAGASIGKKRASFRYDAGKRHAIFVQGMPDATSADVAQNLRLGKERGRAAGVPEQHAFAPGNPAAAHVG